MGAGKRTEDGRQKSVVRAITDIYGYRCIIITTGARAAAIHFYHRLRLNVFPPITHGSKGSSKLLDEF